MTIPPISGIPAAGGTTGATSSPLVPETGSGFGNSISSALEAVSGAEFAADAMVAEVATGGEASVQQLMVAMTKASLSVELLIQVRNRAVEAYQEIMRMQI